MTITTSTPATLSTLRDQARTLLNEFDAADGLASYYALYHDPARTTLHLHHDTSGMVDGFIAHCQTGVDLFRPLVTMRFRGVNNPVPDLLRAALLPGRPYLFVVPDHVFEAAAEYLSIEDPSQNMIMRLEPSRFHPDMNVMVVSRLTADGMPKAEILRGDQAVAVAGVNWRSPIFAEIYVFVEPDVRGRGWGRAVVNRVAAELVKSGLTPLYTVAEGNDYSHDLALDTGFIDTGTREVMAQAVRVQV
nr:GNAT family N-acetyltransferase [Anaerolineae bacterium]